jgi:hypothetical protein
MQGEREREREREREKVTLPLPKALCSSYMLLFFSSFPTET